LAGEKFGKEATGNSKSAIELVNVGQCKAFFVMQVMDGLCVNLELIKRDKWKALIKSYLPMTNVANVVLQLLLVTYLCNFTCSRVIN